MDYPTVESFSTRNSALFLMAGLSPRVAQSVNLELYRQTADQDQASEEYVLEDALLNLNKDLIEIGLVVDANSSQIVEDQGKLHDYLSLVMYLLPNTLYPLIKSNDQIKHCIGHIVTGSLGSDETIIQTYLSELGGLDGQPAIVPELTAILDYYYPIISQTESFSDYLKNLYFLAEQERLVIDVSEDSHRLYRDYLKNFIGRMADVVNSLAHQPIYDELCRIQNIVIKDLIAPNNFVAYQYLFTVEATTLPEGIKELHDQQWYHYMVSHPWCLDYYKVRKLTPSSAYIVMMYAFLYALCDTQAAYRQAIAEVSELYYSADITNAINTLYQG